MPTNNHKNYANHFTKKQHYAPKACDTAQKHPVNQRVGVKFGAESYLEVVFGEFRLVCVSLLSSSYFA